MVRSGSRARRGLRPWGAAAAAALILSAAPGVEADIIAHWVHTYDGPAGATDEARDIRVDSLGNVYVTGWSWGGSTFYDYATQKLDAGGTLVWTERLDRGHWDLAKRLALAGDGSVYVTGYSAGDYATVKYDASGEEEWVRVFPAGSGQSFSIDMDIAVDPDGDVYVCGDQGSGETELLLLKYNADGDLLWSRTYGGPESPQATGRRLALWSGYVYVVGYLGAADDLDILTVKYSASGDLEWARAFDGPLSPSDDRGFAMAVDDSGSVLVAGQAARPGHWIDGVVVKYSADGDERWSAWYDGPGNDYDAFSDIAVDHDGSSYASGQIANTNWPVVDFDYVVVKYDAAGAHVWDRTHDGPGAGSNDYARALEIDSAANVYVTGDEFEGPAGVNEDRSIVTIAYDTDGSELWRTTYDGPGSSVDYGFALALGPLGGVFVCGQCDRDPASSGIAYDYLAVKYAETTGIAEADVDRPGVLAARSAPNPFRGSATISWETPERLAGDLLSVAIYDVSGRLVRTLVHLRGAPGREAAVWDGTDRSGTVVSSGVYFCRLSLGTKVTTLPIVFLR